MLWRSHGARLTARTAKLQTSLGEYAERLASVEAEQARAAQERAKIQAEAAQERAKTARRISDQRKLQVRRPRPA